MEIVRVFGDHRIAIDGGMLKDHSAGIVVLSKLKEPDVLDESNKYDPIHLLFKDTEGIDKLMQILSFVKGEMLDDKRQGPERPEEMVRE